MLEEIKVPDISGAENVDVIEVMVAVGDTVAADDALMTLEGDKATMDVPSPKAGVIESIAVKVGDKVSEGSLILSLKVEGAAADTSTDKVEEAPTGVAKMEEAAAPAEETASETEVRVPDISGAENVDVIEILVATGDTVAVDDALLTLEGDKATMDVPSPYAGQITEMKLKVGDKVSEGDLILLMSAKGASTVAKAPTAQKSAEKTEVPAKSAPAVAIEVDNDGDVHAGPGVRRIAHEFGIPLNKIKGTGSKGRIVKEDVQKYVKERLAVAKSGGGFGLSPAPVIDFSRFGEIEAKPLSKIKKLTGINLSRNWVSIPHVTQFDEADITEQEAFRQSQKPIAAEQGIRLTPLVFIMKAIVSALQEFPQFNASLDASGENLIYKKYFNIGVAVDTPNGLMVPVIRDVDKKGMFDLAKELGNISVKARDKGLSIADMQGGCFTISSLGGIGGTAFTPIINAPEVAILGVSKSVRKPVVQPNGDILPRLMLPLSLSYDHRVIDGAEAARFTVFLSSRLADIRNILL